jgi:hypothetical protein
VPTKRLLAWIAGAEQRHPKELERQAKQPEKFNRQLDRERLTALGLTRPSNIKALRILRSGPMEAGAFLLKYRPMEKHLVYPGLGIKYVQWGIEHLQPLVDRGFVIQQGIYYRLSPVGQVAIDSIDEGLPPQQIVGRIGALMKRK